MDSVFEANLRAKYRRSKLSEKKVSEGPAVQKTIATSAQGSVPKSTGLGDANPTAVGVVEASDVSGSAKKGSPPTVATGSTVATKTDKGKQREVVSSDMVLAGNSKARNSQQTKQVDKEDLQNPFEGEPADRRGWHPYVDMPRERPGTFVMHNGDTSWLERNNGKLPLGIRGPERFVWASRPKDLFFAELAPGHFENCSMSQLYACEDTPAAFPRPLCQVFRKGEEDDSNATPVVELSSTDLRVLRKLYGEPLPVPEVPYDSNTERADLMLTFIGADMMNVYIARDNLPLTLDVFDPDQVLDYKIGKRDDSLVKNTYSQNGSRPCLEIPKGAKPLKYRLVDPSGQNSMTREKWQNTHATLILSRSREISKGRSSRVYEAQIDLGTRKQRGSTDPTISSYTSLHTMKFPRRLAVVAKVPENSPESRDFIRNEAKMYNIFPQHFSREYSGFQIVPKSHFPRKLSPLTPHFYGYYEAVGSDGKPATNFAPIVLTEYCGEPVELKTLTQYQKMEIISKFQRIHNLGFIQDPPSIRNIVVMPGTPLTIPLASSTGRERSFRTPSFRIIDFGRARENADSMATEIEMKSLFEMLKVHPAIL